MQFSSEMDTYLRGADTQPLDCQAIAPACTVLDLRILATTDLHGHLRGYDYATGKISLDTGLSRVATLIEQARSECENTLLFDNGDFLQGSELVDFWARERQWREDDIHPMIATMNDLSYDGGTLGNHEFNFGLEYLGRVLQDAAFPLVLANLTTTDNILSKVMPWTILERIFTDGSGAKQNLRVGIVGFLPPQTTNWDGQFLAGRANTIDIVEAARQTIPRIRAAGADIVIALAHTGIDLTTIQCGPQCGENVAIPLAQVPGIDVMICGHSHLTFPNTTAQFDDNGIDPVQGKVHGTPAVMPGHRGSHLGVVDVTLHKDEYGRWHPAQSRGALRPVSCTMGPRATIPLAAEHPDVLAISEQPHLEVTRRLEKTVGTITAPLQSFFALVAPSAPIDIIAQIQLDFVREHLAGTSESDLPLLSATAPVKTGGRNGPSYFIDIPAGPLSLRNVMDLYAFPNSVSIIRATGAEVIEWLEHSAGVFKQIRPGQKDVPLLNPDFPCYNFDIMTGLEYQIDLSQPARYNSDGSLANPDAHRICTVTYRGKPVQSDDRFIVASNNYRSSGAGGFPKTKSKPVSFPQAELRGLLRNKAIGNRSLPTTATRTWRFTPIPDATAWFDTAPAAHGRLNEATGTRLEEIGFSSQGFLRLRMHF